MTLSRLLFIIIICFGAYRYWQSTNNQQFQIDTTSTLAASQPGLVVMKGYHIQSLEPFALEARVLSSKHYTLGREADLSPVDLALGWGPMADVSVIEDIKISQSHRWYRWQANSYPIPRREIETHSANMHMIPATPEIAAAIKAAESGEMIQLSGDLVSVTSADGHWHWKSSLSREDTGAGACELILVKSFTIIEK